MNKKGMIKNTREATWQRMVQFYKWSFSLFFLVFALVLLSDQVYLMALGFSLLAIAYIPVRFVRHIDAYISSKWLVVLAVGMIFYAFHLIAGS